MNLLVTQNRFSNLSWPCIKWIDRTCIDSHLGDFDSNEGWDFLVYQGDDIELVYHPLELIKLRQNEPIGVVLEADSIHVKHPDFPGPLGYAKWRDDVFVLRAGEYASRFLEMWRSTPDVSLITWKLGVMPCMYPSGPGVIVEHCPLDAEPVILWGLP